MKHINILSSELPEIDESIKECINLGRWLLFRSKELNKLKEKPEFCLKVGHIVYLLNKQGQITQELKDHKESLRIDEVFYFSDLPKPQSISNIQYFRSR